MSDLYSKTQLDVRDATIKLLEQELNWTRAELSVYRLASERAIDDAQQFDASLFLSGDRGVEDVMRRELVEKYNCLFEIYTVLQKAGVPVMEPKQAVSKIELLASERDLWQKRANALLEIAKAAADIVGAPYLLRDRDNYLVTGIEYERLQRAVESCKRMSEEEGR